MGIHGRTLFRASEGEIAEREEMEDICEGCVYAIVAGRVVIFANVV